MGAYRLYRCAGAPPALPHPGPVRHRRHTQAVGRKTSEMRRVFTLRSLQFGWPILLASAGIVFPIVYPDPATMTVAVITLIYATMATSWNIFSGYTGYISL